MVPLLLATGVGGVVSGGGGVGGGWWVGVGRGRGRITKGHIVTWLRAYVELCIQNC